MKKDNTITVFYDEVTRKDIYRLNGVDVTDTIEMLKEKWERQILDTRCRLFQLDMSIQQRLQDQLELTEKALELMAKSVWSDGTSCMKFLDTGIQVNSQVEYLEYFKTKAKEMMKSE